METEDNLNLDEATVVKNPEVNETSDKLNHWTSIWLRPRQTVRKFMNEKWENTLFVFAMIGGIGETLDRVAMKSLGDQLTLPIILLASLVGGPINGLFRLYVGGALIRFTGKWLGGKATQRDIRTAIAVAYIPTIIAMILWIPELVLFRKENFTTLTPNIDSSILLSTLFYIFALVELIIGIWIIVIFLKCLSEVQGFSTIRALSNLILSLLVIVVPILVFIVLISGV